MIHGLRIKDGKATYVSRFVRTSRLKQEEFFGGAKFMKVYFNRLHILKKLSCQLRLLSRNVILYASIDNRTLFCIIVLI